MTKKHLWSKSKYNCKRKRSKGIKSRLILNATKRRRERRRDFSELLRKRTAKSKVNLKTPKTLVKRSRISCWLLQKLMTKRKKRLKKIGKISNKRPEKEIFSTRMLLPLKRKKKIRLVSSKLLKTSWKSFKIKFRVTKLKLKNFKNWSINLKMTSKSMVLKLPKQTPNTINVLNK